ncbi:hypothetical protein N656DRAFT_785129 [Canariomyces notabilis]|uniref:NACHT-NTPase and P-loop NTPases N-terminal domain-containing protein n=1 Tax=Canariomyces notabilis TaxID=2074819 RepID=A0AAN6QDL3_9PEZI|nr:hypothetical protein N656DRAFT_785129 [Canariomyces arenarius]
MSGAEVIGAISGIVALLDVAVKLCGAVKDASRLPSLRAAKQRLPLIADMLQAVRYGLETAPSRESYASMMLVLEGCEKKVQSLHKALEVVVSASGASASRRVATAMRTMGKGKKVEGLMKGILEDIQLLASQHAINDPTRDQIKDLASAVEHMQISSATEPGIERHHQRHLTQLFIANYGQGPQNTHHGNGNQNINTGEAPQFSGTFTGSFHFTPPVTPRSSP